MLVVIVSRRSNTSSRIKLALPTCALRFLSFQNLYTVLPNSTEKKRSISAIEHETATDIAGASPKLYCCRSQSPGPLGNPSSPRTMVVVTLAVNLSVANYSQGQGDGFGKLCMLPNNCVDVCAPPSSPQTNEVNQ